jgi:hypothetical protein
MKRRNQWAPPDQPRQPPQIREVPNVFSHDDPSVRAISVIVSILLLAGGLFLFAATIVWIVQAMF